MCKGALCFGVNTFLVKGDLNLKALSSFSCIPTYVLVELYCQ